MPEPTSRTRPPRARTRTLAVVAATLALLGGSIALAPAAVAATGVTVTAPGTVAAGAPVTVAITADAGADLFAYDLTVRYDPALLQYAGASETYPAGGFGAVTQTPGVVSFTHTRLGTSPGLTGAQTLVTFSFTALASGAATVTLTGATFLDSAGTPQPLPVPVSTPVQIDPAVSAPPAGPAPSASPSPAAGAPSAGSGSGGGGGASAGTPAGMLGETGGDPTGWLVSGAIGIALVALGTVFAIRRRRGEVAL